MSHVVANTEFVITDLDAFAAACEMRGMEFRRNQKTWKWYGRWVKDYHAADAAYKHGIKPEDYGKGLHAAGVKGEAGGYELGLVANPNGEGFVPVYDFYGSGRRIIDAAGKGLEELRKAYSEVVAMKVLGKVTPGKKVWKLTKQTLPDGTIKITGTR